ncbi:MAG: SyrP protein, partial [Gammaproteobacteria bacterium]|nr:SyrP protein [Gammaproteobacteria bacterium]
MFPVIFDSSSEPVSTEEWVRQNRVAIDRGLKEAGVVLIRGLAMQNPGDFNRFVAAFGLPVFSYQESLSNAVRINYSDRVFTANEAPPEVEIYLHHEMAQTPVSPSVLFFCCISAAEQGG